MEGHIVFMNNYFWFLILFLKVNSHEWIESVEQYYTINVINMIFKMIIININYFIIYKKFNQKIM